MSVAFMVEGAGLASFNGEYVEDVDQGPINGAPAYRKVQGAEDIYVTTVNRNADGHWYMGIDYSGDYYCAQSAVGAQKPPPLGWRGEPSGLKGEPRLRYPPVVPCVESEPE